MSRISNHHPEVLEAMNDAAESGRPRCPLCGRPAVHGLDGGPACVACTRFTPTDRVPLADVCYTVAVPAWATDAA